MNVTPTYVFGHADLEIERLQLQAAVLAPVTRRLIRECVINSRLLARAAAVRAQIVSKPQSCAWATRS